MTSDDANNSQIYRFLPSIASPRHLAFTLTPEEARRRLIDPHHTLVEYFERDAVTKVYLDYDSYIEGRTLADGPPPQADVTAAFNLVNDHVTAIMAVLQEQLDDVLGHPADCYERLARMSCRIASRCGWCATRGKWKLSFRPFIAGVGVTYHHIPNIIQLTGLTDFWDASVYKKSEQLLAAINGCKTAADPRKLVPLNDHGRIIQADAPPEPPFNPSRPFDFYMGPIDEPYDVLDYLAQYVGTDAVILDYIDAPSSADTATRIGSSSGSTASRAFSPMSEPTLRHIVMSLAPSRSVGREQWLRSIFAIRSAVHASAGAAGPAVTDEEGRRIAHDFAKQAGRRKYGRKDTDAVFDGGVRDGGVTIATLLKWLKHDSPTAFKEALRMLRQDAAQLNPPDQATAVALASSSSLVPFTDDVKERFIRQLLARWPDKFASLSDPLTCAVTRTADEVRFEGGGVRGRMNKAHVVYICADDDAPDEFLGLLVGDVPIAGPMFGLHKYIAPDAEFLYSRESEATAQLKSAAHRMSLAFIHPHARNESEMLVVKVEGKVDVRMDRSTPANCKKIDCLGAKVLESTARHVTATMGCPAGVSLFLQNINIGSIGTLHYHAGEGEGRSDDATLGRRASASLRCWGRHTASSSNTPLLPLVALTSRNFYGCAANGVWAEIDKDLAANRLRAAVMAETSLWNSLSPADRKHIGSSSGCAAVLTTMLDEMLDPAFASRLDRSDGSLAFDNGLLDLSTREFRPIRPEDMIGRTLGYSFAPIDTIPPDDIEVVRRFYTSVLPVEEERELVLRLFGYALGGQSNEKHFVVLTDVRDGNNGKSTLMDALSDVFGTLSAPTQINFLYHTREADGSNSHAANDLSYAGKRLAVFDETDKTRKFDVNKIKRLTGGGVQIGARGCNDKHVTNFKWTAFIAIACNQNNFPQIDASDKAFERRLLAVPMRSKFDNVSSSTSVESEPYTYPIDLQLKKTLERVKLAHLHVLLEANARYNASGLPPLPQSCIDFRRRVIVQADPLLAAVKEFVEENVAFDLERSDDDKGKKVLGYLKRDDLVASFCTGEWRSVKKGDVKIAFDAAFTERGCSLVKDTKTRDGGVTGRITNVYPHCGLVKPANSP